MRYMIRPIILAIIFYLLSCFIYSCFNPVFFPIGYKGGISLLWLACSTLIILEGKDKI